MDLAQAQKEARQKYENTKAERDTAQQAVSECADNLAGEEAKLQSSIQNFCGDSIYLEKASGLVDSQTEYTNQEAKAKQEKQNLSDSIKEEINKPKVTRNFWTGQSKIEERKRNHYCLWKGPCNI